jgi:hypothetical protein
MARYYFSADFHGIVCSDDIGEELATLEDARAHALAVATELSRNTSYVMTVHVLSEDRTLLASMTGVRPFQAFNDSKSDDTTSTTWGGRHAQPAGRE